LKTGNLDANYGHSRAPHGHAGRTGALDGATRRVELTLVEMRTDAGIVGVGEISTGPQAVVCKLLDHMAPVILGLDPLAVDAVWNKLFSITVPRPGGLGGWDGLPPPLARNQRPQFMAAMAGIDIALWDIAGKAASKPVFRLLGGTRTDVHTYAVGGFYEEGAPLLACADELAGYVAKGFRSVKLKSGAFSLADEVARTRAVREAIGPEIQYMLDLNAPYDVNTCIRFAREVAKYDIYWLEEPLHWYLQPADYVTLAKEIPMPLAHGEREWHRFTVRDFIDAGAASCSLIAHITPDSARRCASRVMRRRKACSLRHTRPRTFRLISPRHSAMPRSVRSRRVTIAITRSTIASSTVAPRTAAVASI
jgi:L-alanine-DL-glutamate epimerase-like enolase superfamily enzyme